MAYIREYVLSVTAAAILCALISAILKSGPNGKLIRILCSVVLAVTILKPLLGKRLDDLRLDSLIPGEEVKDAIADGKAYAHDAMAGIIKDRTESYIQDKAAQLGITIQAEVTLSEDAVPVPCGVRLRGDASPYSRKQLEQYMEEALGSSKEHQQWID